MGLLSAIQDEQFWRDVAKNGRGLLQGASNAVASNITGPVDLINAGMGLLGMPISREPVGGEAWARKKGLTAAAPGAAGLAGETLGLVVPMVAAGKAPQIAAGMLKMADNAAAPSAANQAARNQLGAIVYHGSPHKFDRFDASKIGTGEGAQAYGHGLYFAESPEVAKSYLAAGQSVNASSRPQEMVARAIDAAGGDESKAIAWLTKRLSESPNEFKKIYSDAISNFENLKPQSALYKVDLPDNAIARMLDWDKPLSQQAPEVQAALANTKNKHLRAVVDYASTPYSTPGLEWEVKTMGEAIKLLGMNQSPAKGSQMLAKQGIPGIRYLDGGSRGAGAGTSNYVVFPGEESLLKILERNGVAP